MSSLHKVSHSRVEEPPEQPDSLFGGLDARTISLAVIALGVTVFLLEYMQTFFAPMAFGLLLFYALDPAVDALERVRVPRWLGAAVILGVTVGTIGGGAYLLQDQAMTAVNQLPSAARRVTQLLARDRRAAPGPLQKVEQAAAELQKSEAKPAPGVVRVQVEEPRMTATSLMWTGSVGALYAFNQLIMILFLTYFILLSDKMLRRKFVELAGPTLSKKKLTVEIIDSIASQIGRFLLVQVFTSLVVGLVTWAALSYMGLQQAPLWGLVAGVFNSIPYYGPLIVSSGLSMVAFLQFGTLKMALGVAGVSLAITSLEGWLLTPMLMGRVASMNRVAVFVGLLFWSWAWGVWGMLLAVPMMMSIKVICDHVDELKPVGRFLGE
ncbi:MAG TPA: AI-2E family transporter [Vicinamibacterales bacterium]|nr:AI-2E family transporter [Vicinamibacterales bacterium]